MVEFTESALYQLARIRSDEQFSLEARRAMAQKIIRSCERLARFPYLGRPGREAGTREISVKPFVIVYELLPSGPKILFIWHSRQSR